MNSRERLIRAFKRLQGLPNHLLYSITRAYYLGNFSFFVSLNISTNGENASGITANHLKTRSGDPSLVRTRFDFDPARRPIEYNIG